MKGLVAALSLLLALAPIPAQAQFTKSTLSSQVAQQFPDNTTGAITPSALRSFLQNDLIPSFQQFTAVNPQAGTSYTIQQSDYGQLVTFNNALPVAVTLPQAIAPFTPFNVTVRNIGIGAVTVTPQGGSTINGAASLTVADGMDTTIISDGTNYQITTGSSLFKALDNYGVSVSNTPAANLAALQAAINATPVGGTLFALRAGYAINGLAIINKNMRLVCASSDVTVSPTFTQVTTSSNTLAIRAGNVTVDNCSIGLAGNPTGTSTGIIVGDDALQMTGAFVSGNTTVTCAACTFTSADVGKSLNAVGMGAAGGPLQTNIASVTDGTHVVVGVAPGATNAATTFSYGFDYQEIILQNVKSYNHARALNIVSGSRYHVLQSYFLAADPLIIQNILWGDTGDGEIIGSTIAASVAGSHNAVEYNSGGALRFIGNKVLAQAAISNCVEINWNYVTSVGPFMSANSIEGGCVNGINIDGSVAIRAGTITGGEIAVNGTGISAAPSIAHPSWGITGVTIRASSNNTGMSLANMTAVNVVGNVVENTDASPSGTAYVIASTATGYLNAGFTSQANTLTNASSSMLIDNPQGMLFANLPSVAANGSRIFVSNGAPSSTPCTGASTGATAFRQNGAWSCGTSGITALTGDVTATGPGSVPATIAANAVTNAKLAQMATKTIKGNNTGGTANAADLTASQVAALFTPPTTQVFLSGSGTYTAPANVTWIEVTLVGGGSGGQGSGTGAGNSLAGGNTTFSTLTGNGGAASVSGGTPGGAGSGGDLNLTGGTGGAANGNTTVSGGNGGTTPWGGAGWGQTTGAGAGVAGIANTGSGGGGGNSFGTANAGSGGGGGGTVFKIISPVSATYSYAVGAGATGGTAGTGGVAGGNGGSGFIRVVEHYN